jgi:phosphate:Na+ symporter
MVEQLEDNGDEYEDVLGAFLMKLSSHELSDRQEKESTIFLHTLSDYERISDHAMKVANSAKEINEKKISFSDEAAHEIAVMASAVREILQLTVAAFDKEDVEIASNVEPLEEVIDDISDSMKLNHIERLQSGSCNIEQGFIFNDIITDYERISDHCANIAVALLEIYSDTSAEQGSPEYMRESEHYDKCYEEYKSRFSL